MCFSPGLCSADPWRRRCKIAMRKQKEMVSSKTNHYKVERGSGVVHPKLLLHVIVGAAEGPWVSCPEAQSSDMYHAMFLLSQGGKRGVPAFHVTTFIHRSLGTWTGLTAR